MVEHNFSGLARSLDVRPDPPALSPSLSIANSDGTSYGKVMERLWKSDGKVMEKLWKSDGTVMEKRWESDGKVMEK